MARAAREALADQRALEKEHERENPLGEARVTGSGATPSMGLSEHRGGGATPSMGLSEYRGGHRDGAGHSTGAGEEGKALYAHLSGLHGSGFADAFFKGALGSTIGSKVVRGGNASQTGQFQGEGHMTGGGHIVGAGDMGEMASKVGDMVIKTKAQAKALVKKVMKLVPEKVAEGKAFLEKLSGKGRCVGAGWWGDLVSWVMSHFGKKSAAAVKSFRSPIESAHDSGTELGQTSQVVDSVIGKALAAKPDSAHKFMEALRDSGVLPAHNTAFTPAHNKTLAKAITAYNSGKVGRGSGRCPKAPKLSGEGWWDTLLDWAAKAIGVKRSYEPVADFASAARAANKRPSGSVPPPFVRSALNDMPKTSAAEKLALGDAVFKKGPPALRDMATGSHDQRLGNASSNLADLASFGRSLLTKGKGKAKRVVSAGDGRRSRAEIVKKVMAEKGLPMIEASKYVKAHNLY